MAENRNQAPEIIFAKAQRCEKQGNWPEAINLYKALLKFKPNYPEAHHNLAIALRHDGQEINALKYAQMAANLAPENPVILFSLGISLEKIGQYAEAIDAYMRTLELRPNYTAVLSNLGRVLEIEGKINESIGVLEQALKYKPKATEVIINLANSHLSAGQPNQSTYLLNKLVKNQIGISSDILATASNSLGVAAQITNKKNLAIRHFSEAIEYKPDFAEAHENLAQALLSLGQYEKAWVEYEWRWHNPSNQQTKRRLPGLQWNGEKSNEMKLLIHTEQGFGDVIQFVRFLSLIDIGEGKLILACHKTLVDFLSTLSCVNGVVDIKSDLPEYDRHIPLLSLPRVLEITKAKIPNAPYLSGSPPARKEEKNQISIGITWAGVPRHENDPYRNRSCPIDLLKPLMNIRGIKLYSLQTGPQKNEIGKIDKAGEIVDLSDKIKSFKDTADLISELDLVITIDTAVAHLAGAIGKNVWILLAKSHDWRWNERDPKNIWYPTSRLFIQKSPGNWTDPIDEIIAELNKLIP